MITYSLKESGVFYVTFSGDVSKDNVMDYLDDFEKIGNLPKNLLTFYDLREANMFVKYSDILAISRKAKKVTNSYETVKTAFIVDSPGLTAYVMLYIMQSVRTKSVRKVFSTTDAAYKWLLEDRPVSAL